MLAEMPLPFSGSHLALGTRMLQHHISVLSNWRLIGQLPLLDFGVVHLLVDFLGRGSDLVEFERLQCFVIFSWDRRPLSALPHALVVLHDPWLAQVLIHYVVFQLNI